LRRNLVELEDVTREGMGGECAEPWVFCTITIAGCTFAVTAGKGGLSLVQLFSACILLLLIIVLMMSIGGECYAGSLVGFGVSVADVRCLTIQGRVTHRVE